MPQLHPQEVYLLEYLVSLEHFCNVREAMRQAVRYGEQALDEFMQHIPTDLRSRHQSLQPDVVWGGRVMPNLRNSRDAIIRGCILRSHDDAAAFNGSVGSHGGSINKHISDFDDTWMPEPLSRLFWDNLYLAIQLDKLAGTTLSGAWLPGNLTWNCDFKNENGLLAGTGIKLPEIIPNYELDATMVIHPGDKVEITGVYLPTAENTCAQFLHPGWNKLDIVELERPEILVRQGLAQDEYGRWIEEHYIETTWTLVRQIPGQFIEVPADGFFPQTDSSPGRVVAPGVCSATGWWWTPAKEGARRYFEKGERMPDFPQSAYGQTIWYRETV
ncbi:hypothetical protein N8I74_18945 [Chitiniphilus purpureus]|uniref:Uncharacterized protein n=1 Tax=Chitiniphilus purpureus TaxID=2981137 RepID=A0ABY6DLX1_9NEIS|nr:hypothetical protein [Chitiniphilus sp. CD1]UXY15360.1 hypothetical protein N8I74_18945 [Chitiniphilus sp. CD1]